MPYATQNVRDVSCGQHYISLINSGLSNDKYAKSFLDLPSRYSEIEKYNHCTMNAFLEKVKVVDIQENIKRESAESKNPNILEMNVNETFDLLDENIKTAKKNVNP